MPPTIELPKKKTVDNLRHRWPHGPALVDQIRRETNSNVTLLSFSRGKDSIVSWIKLREAGIQVVPYFCYPVPGLRFEEEDLQYWESFFETRIYRVLHPSFYRDLSSGLYQSPMRQAVHDATEWQLYDWQDVSKTVAEAAGMPHYMTAIGTRIADSVLRRTNLTRNGPINRKKRTWQCIWDLTKEGVLDVIRKAGCRLPIDYRLFNKSFDALTAEFLIPMKKALPEDYQRIVDWYPLIEVDLYRYKMMRGADA